MAGTVLKVIEKVIKKIKPKPKIKKFSTKNDDIGRIKQEGLYKTLGRDKK